MNKQEFERLSIKDIIETMQGRLAKVIYIEYKVSCVSDFHSIIIEYIDTKRKVWKSPNQIKRIVEDCWLAL